MFGLVISWNAVSCPGGAVRYCQAWLIPLLFCSRGENGENEKMKISGSLLLLLIFLLGGDCVAGWWSLMSLLIFLLGGGCVVGWWIDEGDSSLDEFLVSE